jgi:putative acetyltransferase
VGPTAQGSVVDVPLSPVYDSGMVQVSVRRMRPDEARRFLDIHHDSVRGLAAKDYPIQVIETWAPLPITNEAVSRFLSNRDDEIRLIAEVGGRAVGIGALVVANSELRACYVLPSAARQGIGAALVAEIERLARKHGLAYLQLESSVTAEPFYAAMGYFVEERAELLLRPGITMAAVKMRKVLV